jgi:hypothetical protein
MGRGSDFSCVVEAMGVELITGDSTWKISDSDPKIVPLLWLKIPLTE